MKKFIIILIVLGIAGYFGWRKWAKPAKPAAPTYREEVVTRGTVRRTIQATGTVQPQNRVELGSPVAGRLEDVLVREGESVTKGQTLAWISSTDRAALLDAARSKGPDELKRWEEIYKPTPLIAPLDGEIIARKLEPGQTISSENPILVMSDRLIVEAQVDETDIASIATQQQVEIVLDAYPEHMLSGVVDHVAYEAEEVENVTVYKIDVLPHDPPDFLRSGMTASLTFIAAEKKDVLLLPIDTIKDGQVLVPNPAGPPASQAVETGIEDGKLVEVKSGLKEGDRVVVEETSPIVTGNDKKGNPLLPWNRMPRRPPPRR